MRVLVLVDGFETEGLLGSLARLLRLGDAELVLLYVRHPGARAGLELGPQRPGGHHLPPHRERELAEAERTGSSEALAEAEQLAGPLAAAVRSIRADGEPGQVVCDLARKEVADVVALRGTGRGRPPVGPGSLGPTARFVVDHSPCPVLLLRDGG
jgi:nucleotide-binding universal stress UspA family protein